MENDRTLVIGLVGGIGSGKSAVAAELARRGARVIPADQLGHEALRQSSVRDEVVRRWGEGILDAEGQIERKKLAGIIFADEKERRRLEELVHPWIRQRMEQIVAEGRRQGLPLLVVDAAVLLEAGWYDLCDRLVYVDAPAEIRRQRVSRNRAWSNEEWEKREAAQLPLTWKHSRADHVLDNSSSLQHLNQQIDELMQHWQRTAICPGEA